MNSEQVRDFADAIADVMRERARQLELGWTPEHDDQHGTGHVANLIQKRLGPNGPATAEEAFVEIAALAVAGIELCKRRARA